MIKGAVIKLPIKIEYILTGEKSKLFSVDQ